MHYREIETITSSSYSHRMSHTWQGTSAQSQLTMATTCRRRRTIGHVKRITKMSLLLLYSGFNTMNQVTALSSQTRRTNKEADISEGYDVTLVESPGKRSETKLYNEDIPSVRSPNFISTYIQQSEAATFDSEVRRTQTNAACSANPECAAAGLVNDCCPTSSGMFLLCCSSTLSPGACLF